MQIPEFDLFWTIAGAFAAGGLTWLLDYMWVKRKTVETADDSRLVALQERARLVEPLRAQLDHAKSQVADLESRLATLPEPGSAHAADLTVYQSRIDELLVQAGAAQQEKQALHEELQQIKTVAGQAHEQGQFVEQLRAELALLQGEAAERVAMVLQLKNENDALRHGAASLSPELEVIKARLQQAEAEASLLREKSAGMERQLAVTVSADEYQTLQKRFASLQSDLESLRQAPTTPDLTDTVKLLRDQLAQAQAQGEIAARALAEMREQRVSAIDATDQKIADLEAELATARTTLEERAQQLRAAHAELRAAAAASEGPTVEPLAIEQWRQQLEAANARVSRAEAAQAALEVKARDALAELDQLRSVAASAPPVDVGALTAESERWLAAYGSAQTEIERLRAQLAAASERPAEVSAAAQELQGLRSQLERAEDKVFEALKEASELREQLSAVDEIRSEAEQLRATLPALEEIVQERDELAIRLQQVEARQEEALAKGREAAQARRTAEERAEAMQVELSNKDGELTRLSRRLPELDHLVSELREELGQKASRIETLEAVDSEAAELRARVQQVSAQLELSQHESHEIRSALAQIQAEVEMLRESAGELETIRAENLRMKGLVASAESAKTDIAPLRTRVNELFATLGDTNKENEGNRKALQSTLEELRKLRHDVGEINRLQDENAKLRARRLLDSREGNEPDAVSGNDPKLADSEIALLRKQMARSSELGEIS